MVVDGVWVLVGVKRTSQRKVFLVTVENRNEATMITTFKFCKAWLHHSHWIAGVHTLALLIGAMITPLEKYTAIILICNSSLHKKYFLILKMISSQGYN